MESIYKRKNENGTTVWRAVIRIKGYPTVCESFERKQQAEDWANETERSIKLGQFNFAAHNQHHTYAELLGRMEVDGVLSHHRSFKNCRFQFEYWKGRFGSYALVHITPELIAQERKLLIDSPLPDGSKRSPATINRYTAVLSSTLSYAVKKLRWISENPCKNLTKLKEGPGRDRILNDEEINRLLVACKQSKSPYLCSSATQTSMLKTVKNSVIISLREFSKEASMSKQELSTLSPHMATIFVITRSSHRDTTIRLIGVFS